MFQLIFSFRDRSALKSVICFSITTILFASTASLAQVSDNFSDGDFSTNPTWAGTESKFTVTSNRLKLQAPAVNDNAYLSGATESINDASWEFFVRMEFNPSSSNYCRVYLTSNQPNLSGSLNGYFVGIGNASDEISLYKQSGSTISEIIDGVDNRLNLSIAEMKVKVTRDAIGNWTLFTDVGATGTYITEGDSLDNTFNASTYAGVYCLYTSTRSDKFFFDDFIITGDAFVDEEPPLWETVSVLSETELELKFSEPLDPASISSLTNYDVESFGNPVSATLQDDVKLILTFNDGFPNGYEQTLTVSNILDTAGNVLQTSNKSFLYFEATPTSYRGVMITEIFPDFSPIIGLPEGEFVEILNRSDNPIQLSGWTITDGSSQGTLGDKIMLPGEYVILTNSTHASEYGNFGATVPVANFPTLNNSSDFLLLKDGANQPIDSVRYYSSWFSDDDKKLGGWSLELIDPENICKGDDNWIASNGSTGGTPGSVNSVFETIVDLEGPKLLQATQLSDTIVTLAFDEKLDETLPVTSQLHFQPNLEIAEVSFLDPSLKALRVTLSSSLIADKSYLVSIDDIKDCPGNMIGEFDHVYLNPDTIAPFIDSLVVSQNSILIRFNEKVVESDAETTGNFHVGSLGVPTSAELHADGITVTITFSENFQNGATQQLLVSQIHDINDNAANDTVPFIFFQPSAVQSRDVIITEIFPDPAPVIGLPEGEFVEIFNRSANAINLKGWRITDGFSQGILSEKIILPGQLLILSPTSQVSQFSLHGDVLAVNPFPSLNNTGDNVVLLNADSVTIDSVHYSSKWYGIEDKEDGGWTLELRDPENICLGESNWMASKHTLGGTPGQTNSVNEIVVDQIGPKFINALVDSASLELVFDERLKDELPLVVIQPSIEIESLAFNDSDLKTIQVSLAAELETFRTYSVLVSNAFDCPGNPLDSIFNKVMINPDTSPPTVDSVAVISNHSLILRFNERLAKLTVENLENYKLNEAVTPISAFLQADDLTVLITFDQNFTNGSGQTLHLKDIADINGNTSTEQINFVYFLPAPVEHRDIVITEIFADPTPMYGLPEAEFIEIFNRSENPIDLKNWILTDGGSQGKIQGAIIMPNEYVILCPSSSASKFQAFGKTVAVTSFPSLNNTRDTLVLRDPQLNLIDSVAYASSQYNDNEKADGGWTLELINPEDICKGSFNWSASVDTIGGTPGKENSIFNDAPDVVGPTLLSVMSPDSVSIKLQFNEKLDQDFPIITIEPRTEIIAEGFLDLSLTGIALTLREELIEGKSYVIKIENIRDCAGNFTGSLLATLNPDSIPPLVESITVISDRKLRINFSEKAEPSSLKPACFESNALSISELNQLADNKTIEVSFKESFGNGVEQTILIRDVTDINGNMMIETERSFMLFDEKPVHQHDLRITEIFADPSPSAGLPELEFIEIFNRSDNPINLQNFSITDGSAYGKISASIILPRQYTILAASSSTGQLATFGKAVGVTNFPTLNNSGDALVLIGPSNQTIDSVNYSVEWYHDEDAAAGGYSLEIIDPENHCAEEQNWITSESQLGGTPGTQNSVFANKPDLTGPKLLSVIANSNSTLSLLFDEKLSAELPLAASITITDAEIDALTFADKTLRKINVTLKNELIGGRVYYLSASNIYDCAGNLIDDDHAQATFGLAEMPAFNDLVINEILFNPRPMGVDFIEIYNQSEKFINLKNWKLANNVADSLVNLRVVTDADLIIAPLSYLVFTSESNVLKGEYPQGREQTFFELKSLPSMNDDDGNIVLLDSALNPVDAVSYSEKFHSVFIKEDEGVSLERVSAAAHSLDEANWKSATQQSGLATPGYVNSNTSAEIATDQALLIDPQVFEPVYGQPNFTKINYQFNKSGFIANVKIVDSGGRTVKTVAENTMLDAGGFLTWDGDQDNGSKARIGSYMIWFEVFDELGAIHTIRKPVVVAGKF